MKRSMNISRILALLLTATLLLGMLVIPASATGFSDVSSTSIYLDAINYMTDNGFMAGTSSTTFSPNTTATRAMFIAVLYQKAGAPEQDLSDIKFSDVSSTDYYAAAVVWAKEEELISGTGDNLFSPNNAITRQDAIVILYQYAKKICEYDVSIDALDSALATSYSDYSSVSDYAVNAITWAISHGLISSTSTSTKTISPKASLIRAQMAMFIMRFGTNIDGIVIGKDNISFNNSATSGFTRSCYYISDAHYQRLKNNAEAYYIAESSDYLTKTLKFEDKLSKNRKIEWSGSCYGMAAVVALDKTGQIAFNENYYPTAKTMYEVELSRGGNVESAINYYQLAQNIGSFMRGDAYGTNILKAVSACQANDGLSLISYFWEGEGEDGESETFGHSVLVDTVTESSANVYTFIGYNPNQGESNTFTITSGGLLKNNAESIQLTNIQVLTNLSVLDIVDIDYFENYDNLTTTSAASVVTSGTTAVVDSKSQNFSGSAGDSTQSVQSHDLSSVSLLTVKLNGTFIITNAEGEYLYWDGAHLTGSMEVYSESMTIEGEAVASDLEIEVPWSNSFSFVPGATGSDSWFSVTNSSCYARIAGENIEQAFIDESGYIELLGENMEYEIAYGGNVEDSPLYTLGGANSDSISVTSSDNGLIAFGLVGLCSVKATSMTDWSSVEAEFTADATLNLIDYEISGGGITITSMEENIVQ